MSGSYLGQQTRWLCEELYYHFYCDYGEKGFKKAVEARRINPLEDIIMSELFFDALCVVYSYDYYKSGDIREDTYQKDVKYFKDKWLKKGLSKAKVKEIVDDELTLMKDKLYNGLGVEEENDEV